MIKRIVALASLLLGGASLYAAAPRTFVSSTGVDTNPCTRPQPCRSFTAALVQTSAGGTIVPLDTAGYGAVTIGQSVSIVVPEGVYAGITATSGNGVTISGTAATDIVLLSGLTIEGAGTGDRGIEFFDAIQSLIVRNCSFSGFVAFGIDFFPTNSGASLYVGDTTFSGMDTGVSLYANSGVNAAAYIERCRAFGNTNFGYRFNNFKGTVSHSVAAGNSFAGIYGVDCQVTIDDCDFANNATGIICVGNGVMRVSNTTVTDNGTGLAINVGILGGSILTRIDDATYAVKTNTVENNGTNGTFTGTFVAD